MKNIFRAYDIRGLMETEITPETVEKVGKAFGTYLGTGKKVVVGRDARLNGEKLQAAFMEGLTSTGNDAIDIGMVATPVLNFYCKHSKADAGVIISASHNPKEYNGVRFRKEDGTGNTECIPKIKELFFSEEFKKSKNKGGIKEVDSSEVNREYVDYVLGKIKLKNKISLVLDPGNGAACNICEELFSKAGCDVSVINNEINGNFPGRGPEPNDRTLIDLDQEVRINSATVGIAFDGDADRVVFVDENGETCSAEEAGSVLIPEILKKKKGVVCVTVDCSMAVEDVIKEHGGTPVRTKVGDAFLAESIKENNAVFAMESSDHFLIPEILPSDDGMMIGLYLANILSESGEPLSQLIKKLKSYPVEKLTFDCGDEKKFDVMEKIRKEFEGKYNMNMIDGLRIDVEDAWVLLRPSNTSPILRLTVEAKTKEKLEELKNAFVGIIESAVRDLNG